LKTKVLFRYWKGSVIALFPELAATNDPLYCSRYLHVGQHGAAWPALVVRQSRPALPEEYRDLRLELESRHEYELEVVQKVPRDAYHTRYNDILAGLGR